MLNVVRGPVARARTLDGNEFCCNALLLASDNDVVLR